MIHFLCLHRKALRLTIFRRAKNERSNHYIGCILVGEMAKNYAESELAIDEAK